MAECKRCKGSGAIGVGGRSESTACPDCMVPREGMWERDRVWNIVNGIRLGHGDLWNSSWHDIVLYIETKLQELDTPSGPSAENRND